MRNRSTPRLAMVVILSLGSFAASFSQTKKDSPSTPAGKSPPRAAKTIPIIKCTDSDSVVACKSFKQLVDARDKGLLDSLTGERGSRRRHFAYVCPRPKSDVFKVVEFDEPQAGDYRPYSPADAASNNLSSVLLKTEAFPLEEGKPFTPHMDAQDKWYEDHDGLSMYGFGSIYIESWENGILSDYASDVGKWRRALNQAHTGSDEDADFESAHQWLAHFNEANANQLAAADNPKYPRISVSDIAIYLRYDYENKNNGDTEYTLNIQRSTGRFTESFEATGTEPFEDSGTCMSFRY